MAGIEDDDGLNNLAVSRDTTVAKKKQKRQGRKKKKDGKQRSDPDTGFDARLDILRELRERPVARLARARQREIRSGPVIASRS